MRFVSIDVETANPNMSSICQIGLVQFENGIETRYESILINPKTWFDPVNTGVHGITENDVLNERTFTELHSRLHDWTANQIVVCHTHFDRVALAQACANDRLSSLSCTWLDSARVVRRTWPQFAKSGYGLANVAAHCGISFQHHDALEDARTCGRILVRAVCETGLSLDEWMVRVNRSIIGRSSIRRDGDGDGALVGEVIVFTGALQIPRREAADRAAEAGGSVEPSVTRNTTLLVVGDQDIDKLNGNSKSAKHMKAEVLIGAGQPIRIIGETDFMALSSIVD